MKRFGRNYRWRHCSAAVIAVVCVAGLLQLGCTRIIKDAPPPPAYQDAEVKTLLLKYNDPQAPPPMATEDDRNKMIEELVFLVDVNYHQFEHQLFMDRASFDTTTDLAVIGLGGAGALINASGTQAILSAISGAITGGRASVSKNYFHEQSTDALISTMRASRAAKLNLLRGAEVLSLKDYPAGQALVDVTDYYNAGTIVGAFQSILAQSGQKEQQASADTQKKVEDKIVATLETLTPSQITDKAALTAAIGTLQTSDLEKIKKAVEELDPKATPPTDLAGGKAQLQTFVRNARTPTDVAKVKKAFGDAGI